MISAGLCHLTLRVGGPAVEQSKVLVIQWCVVQHAGRLVVPEPVQHDNNDSESDNGDNDNDNDDSDLSERTWSSC